MIGLLKDMRPNDTVDINWIQDISKNFILLPGYQYRILAYR